MAEPKKGTSLKLTAEQRAALKRVAIRRGSKVASVAIEMIHEALIKTDPVYAALIEEQVDAVNEDDDSEDSDDDGEPVNGALL